MIYEIGVYILKLKDKFYLAAFPHLIKIGGDSPVAHEMRFIKRP